MHPPMVNLLRYRATSGERIFIEQIKALIFLEAISAIQIMQEPQSNLEEKLNPSILKDDFSSRTDPPIFLSIAPVVKLFKPNQLSFSSNEINKPLPANSQYFVDQTQVQKPILVVATDQMPDHT